MTDKIRNILASEKTEYCLTAFVFHCILLLALSLIISKTIETKNSITITVSNNQEEQILEETIIIPDQSVFDSENTSLNEEVVIQTEESSLKINDTEIPSSVFIEPVDSEISTELNSDIIGQTLSGISTNIGSGVSSEKSAGGALDRLTVEIISSGQSKDTTVVWLLDASVSLNFQRQQIASRFGKIIQELEFANTDHPIVHEVYAFGQSLQQMTPNLTADASILKKSVESITLDESGIENTFNAIGQICKKYAKYRSRLLIIVFTDEVGDDIQLLDTVSHLASSKGSTVYVVGNPAPFGKSTTQFKFVEFDPNYDQTEKWVEIRQGPESLFDIILDIKTLPIDDETLDSGYGSFALSKLCLDTGGIYFSVHPNRSSDKVIKKTISPLSSYISRFFDHDTMIKYKPDYRSIFTQTKEYQTHKTKKSLVLASQIPLHILGEQTLRFKAFDEGTFVNELNMAQRFSAKIEPNINQIHSILLEGESSLTSIDDPRLIASYYLAMGRILATKCRIESYNLILAEAKTGLKKQDPKSNIWILLPSKEFKVSNSVLNKNYSAAQKYLNYIVENFPDTPWSLIAKEELNTPFGYTWVEHYEEPPKMGGGGNGNNNPKDDMAKPKLIPKPKRKIDKI